jgi:hypothetical protein
MNTFNEELEKRKLSIYKSLAAFQQECPVIAKATKGHNYQYADLPTIFEVINPLLEKHGLGFTQLLQGNSIQTILFHVETGETIESLTEIPQDEASRMNIFQSSGSGVTYFRRYALSSMLGIVTDVDTDAAKQPLSNDRFEKQPLSNDRFEKALAAIEKGTIKKEQIINGFKLTPEQLKRLG